MASWKDSHYVTVFRLAKEGRSKNEIIQALGVSYEIFDKWLAKREAFKEAYESGMKEWIEKDGKLERHIFERLSPDLRALWNRLVKCEYGKNDSDDEYLAKTRSRVEIEDAIKFLQDEDKQRLFLYALINSRFSRPEACRKVGLSLETVRKWSMKNEQFKKMVAEVEQIKKSFYESALVSLVEQGDTHAVIFANKTYNRDIGYSEKQEVNTTITVTHKVDELNLSLEVRRQMLEQMRQREERLALEDKSNVIEAKVIE